MACSRRRPFFAVTGLVFPFVYGANEIIASIGRFAIAFPHIRRRQLSTTFSHRTAPLCSCPHHDSALIDDNEGRLRTVQDGAAIDAALAQARDQQLAWWVNHRG
jgi:hypothetical protein